MSLPYVGEIRMFAGNFAPVGWMTCDGQLLSIADYDVLFNLIGTTYGGDGQNTFALPNLSGRIPMHMGGAFTIGETEGVEQVTLTTQQIPLHNHAILANSNNGNQSSPQNGFPAASSLAQFSTVAPTGTLDGGAIAQGGGAQPHDNMMPYLSVTFIISLYGIYPSPN